MATCPKCNTANTETDAFCASCGFQMQAGVERKKLRPRLGNLGTEQHKKHIKSARTAIAVVAGLTLLVSIGLWFFVSNQAEKFEADVLAMRNDPGMVIDESKLAEARNGLGQAKMMVGATFILGCIFLGLFFWAKSNPFGATLTALILYITTILVNAALDPATIAQGIIIKIIIIAVLVNGVKSGLAFKKIQEGV